MISCMHQHLTPLQRGKGSQEKKLVSTMILRMNVTWVMVITVRKMMMKMMLMLMLMRRRRRRRRMVIMIIPMIAVYSPVSSVQRSSMYHPLFVVLKHFANMCVKLTPGFIVR